MKTIAFDEILPLADYERVRERLQPLFIHEKERRRLHVGSHLTFIFENAQTAWYQIEEMIRAEKMTEREAIQHEIDTYNELLPAAGEIAATLLIEYSERGTRRGIGQAGRTGTPSVAEGGTRKDRGKIRRSPDVGTKNQRGPICQVQPGGRGTRPGSSNWPATARQR